MDNPLYKELMADRHWTQREQMSGYDFTPQGMTRSILPEGYSAGYRTDRHRDPDAPIFPTPEIERAFRQWAHLKTCSQGGLLSFWERGRSSFKDPQEWVAKWPLAPPVWMPYEWTCILGRAPIARRPVLLLREKRSTEAEARDLIVRTTLSHWPQPLFELALLGEPNE